MTSDVIRVIYPAIALVIAIAGVLTLGALLRLRRNLPAEKPIARMLLRMFAWLVFAFTVAESSLVVSTVILVIDPDPTHSLGFRLGLGFATQILVLVVIVRSMWELIHQGTRP